LFSPSDAFARVICFFGACDSKVDIQEEAHKGLSLLTKQTDLPDVSELIHLIRGYFHYNSDIVDLPVDPSEFPSDFPGIENGRVVSPFVVPSVVYAMALRYLHRLLNFHAVCGNEKVSEILTKQGMLIEVTCK
jgi:hypothetical protein